MAKFFLIALLALALTGCAAPGPRVVSTRFQGDIFSPGDHAGVLYQDGGQAIAVDGGTIWVFGDTFFGQRSETGGKPKIAGAVSNTIALLPTGSRDLPLDLHYLVGADGVATTALRFGPGEDEKKLRMWPSGGVSVGGKFYLYYSMIQVTDEPGPWNFHDAGSGLASADRPLAPLTRLQTKGSWKFPVNALCVLPAGGFLYCFEIEDQGKTHGLIVSRVVAQQIADPSAYRFFDGKAWVADRNSAKIGLREAYGQVSVVWQPLLKQYLMSTSSDLLHPHEIQLRTALEPWGPWSDPARIAVPEKKGKKTNLIYCAYLHPELGAADGNEIAITFCRMLDGSWELSNPELVTVTLGR